MIKGGFPASTPSETQESSDLHHQDGKKTDSELTLKSVNMLVSRSCLSKQKVHGTSRTGKKSSFKVFQKEIEARTQSELNSAETQGSWVFKNWGGGLPWWRSG